MHQSKHKLLLPIRLLLFCLLGLQELLLADAEISRQNVENRATIADLQALPKDIIRDGIPVTVEGLLTYFEPGHRMAFLQDATGAIYIHAPRASNVKAGDVVEVKGILDPGYGGRNIRGTDFNTSPTIRKVRSAVYPSPIEFPDLNQAASAKGAIWTKIHAKISNVSSVGDRYLISLENFPDLPVYLPAAVSHNTPPGHLRGLHVEMFGIFADTPIQEKPLRMKRIFLVPDITHITVPEEEKLKRFNTYPRGLTTLQWIPEKEGPNIFVRIEGTVTWKQENKGFFLQAGQDAVWVECAEPRLPSVGEFVNCAGQPISYHGSGMLGNAMWIPAQKDTTPILAEKIDHEILASSKHHGRLGKITATLVEKLHNPNEILWIMKTSTNLVFVHLTTKSPPKTVIFEPNTELSMTGVVINQTTPLLDISYTNDVVHLFLRDANDIELLRNPPFWTLRRLYFLLLSAALVTTLVIIWVALLRSKVNKQAVIIKSNISTEIIQSERLRLARQWHDTFEQHFAGLTMQLDAVASLVPEGSDVRNMLDNAAKISDHSRKVARDAIWNLRVSHDVTGITFITQLENALKNAWPNEYDRKLTVQYQKMDQILTEGVSLTLIRIAQESVTNAFKHAHAEHIQVRWQAEGDTATLSIIDDGIGMNVGNIASFASRGHFGILGMKERIAHIGGSFEITSPPPHSSSGTMIAVHVNISASILDSPN
ncbi:MAG: hypothetical protein B9S37_02490 [Verrucomicrobiia bacterium Tous-C3TDCM]|nr:MAG: hypothetical protein B9S37_02490 [Verrucomicrobiae bacterium Tous-C3TDCM]PAZ05439.1 MAG: hypothetical protein CAK88_07965 [Verrucomicrobiae bacterium AMD-G2]